jgi:hypothetical protein
MALVVMAWGVLCDKKTGLSFISCPSIVSCHYAEDKANKCNLYYKRCDYKDLGIILLYTYCIIKLTERAHLQSTSLEQLCA